jgi:enediyne biosynthesis protein E4
MAMLLVFGACRPEDTLTPKPSTLFRLLPSDHTGVDFVNRLEYTEQLNTYTYKNFYSGGGVGLGDINNDGLIDIFFSGNLVSNKLYLNKGNLQFEDISASSGFQTEGVWTTGVSLADINGDGLLDIYLCKSGPPGGKQRYNELFINNGDLTFSEEAREYGLAFEGLSTHAAFFDFDKDGDLDCYLLNNSFRSVGGYDLRVGQRNLPDPLGGNKLLRNDNGRFTDVSAQAGIYTSEIGFGLGVTIGDLNKDGWADMYVSNDFFEKDYLYINNQDGTFRESLEDYMQEISLGSMGADMADINNDGRPEIFVTEMLPETDGRLKTTAQFESWDKYNLNLKSGYFRQFSRNVLQLNNGNGTFSEISRLSGVHATDWSWGALIFDMDNDGLKDIFVANGIYKELLNQDYVNFASNPALMQQIQQRKKGIMLQLIDSIPSTPLSNYSFQNLGNLSFVNKSTEWGLDLPSFSNGSAYGDLDNDGDVDLVLNNVNMPSSIYENRSKELLPGNNTLSFVLHGEDRNSFALGTKITLKLGEQQIYQEASPMRGFMSTVDNRIHVGLGKYDSVDSVWVEWPDGKVTILTNIKSNQLVHLYQKEAASRMDRTKDKLNNPILERTEELKGIGFQHIENDFVDFDRDRLLFNMVSNEGPCLCTGDSNGDGLSDFYIGGAKDQAGALFVQVKSGTFSRQNAEIFEKDRGSEDTDCTFFDANGDGKQDLYVTSGGYEFSSSSTALLDRFYVNTGNGRFKKSQQLLPVQTKFESTATVVNDDYDQDGDQDLFVGTRLVPLLYGIPANGYLLNNDGKGNFHDVTREIAPQLLELGLITDAKWIDANKDAKPDLLIVGEWMPIKVFIQEKGKFVDRSVQYGFDKTNGWYNAVDIGDFNRDGFMDFVVGNHGLNSRFKASLTEPASIVVNDFDQNGSIDHVTTRYDHGVSYPLVLKQDLVMQIPSLKKKYLHFKDYKEKTIADIFSPDQLKDAMTLQAYTFETAVWMNSGKGTFSKRILPVEAQFFPVYGLLVDDMTGDGVLDIVLGGNLFRAKPETGVYAGGYGLLLKGDLQGNFVSVSAAESGLNIQGEIRALKKIISRDKKFILVGKNNDRIQVLHNKMYKDENE